MVPAIHKIMDFHPPIPSYTLQKICREWVDPQEDMVYPKHLPTTPGMLEMGTALRVVIAARQILDGFC